MGSTRKAAPAKAKPAKPKQAALVVPPMPDGSPRSVTQLYGGDEELGECGYCHSKVPARRSWGMCCKQLTALDYQALIDLGWRRSGDYLYKQDNVVSCCCNYTIRLDVTKYRRNKAQRAAVNRFFGAAAAAAEPSWLTDRLRAAALVGNGAPGTWKFK